MRVVLVDDEANARELMGLMLSKISTDIRVVGEASGVDEADVLIRNLNFDILFLDVEMQDGTGFDVLELHPNIKASVIFTTAHNGYMHEAIKKNALDYLLKPISLDELRLAVEKCKKEVKQKIDYQTVLERLRSELHGLRLAVNSTRKIDFINSREVIYCEAEGSYATFHLENGNKIVSTKSLKYFENQLENAGFFRVSKSHLINMEMITQYRKDIGYGQLIMYNGDAINVSRRRKPDFNKQLKEA